MKILKRFPDLHRIHETLLYLVENHCTRHKQDAHKNEAIDKPAPAHKGAATQEAVLEGLDDGSHGIDEHNLMQRRIGDITKRIHDRRRIHP